MSNHLSGKNLTFPAGDARLDLTDVFVFAAPGASGRTVLIMDANTFATGTEFHPDAVYQLHLDTDDDNQPDITFSSVFSAAAAGAQTVTLFRANGTEAGDLDAVGEVIVEAAPVSLGSEAHIVTTEGMTFFAGRRSDPFFADLEGLAHDFAFTGADAFGDKDVFSIVLELPDDALGIDGPFGIWASINLRSDGALTQVDRGAHPSLTAFFNAEEAKEGYNAAQPADDTATYTEPWTQVLLKAGYTGEDAGRALSHILPDVLRYDRSHPVGYPNGRTLTDDVFDARLAFVTNGQVSGDQTGHHTDLLDTFPYLGRPHSATPTA